jgi:chain length determinant protein EpsF
MNLHQFLSILRARRTMALAIFGLTLGLALAWTLLKPSHYTARAPILVDVRNQDPLANPNWQNIVPAAIMATQMDIARSDRVAQKVVQSLGLDKDPSARDDWQKATGGKGNLQQWLAADLQANLEVKPARESNIIQIAYTARSPEQAARVANAFAQAYLDVALDIKTDPAKKYASWFDEQLGFARQRLEEAQGRLTAYQQRTGVISADGVDMETQRLNELSSQLTTVQAQLTEVANKRGAGAGVADVMASPLINGLKADIARQEARIQEASANLGPRHPQMVRMQDELAAMQSRLRAETGSIGNSINTAYEVARARERELSAAVNAQRGRVMQFNRHRDELSVLRKDVDTAQRAFEQLSERASNSKLQALTTQTNVQRLATAVEPLEAKGPGLKAALAIAGFAGLLLAIVGALLLELVNRRVRSVDDLAQASGLPILATLPAHGGKAAMALLAGPSPTRPALGYRGSAA